MGTLKNQSRQAIKILILLCCFIHCNSQQLSDTKLRKHFVSVGTKQKEYFERGKSTLNIHPVYNYYRFVNNLQTTCPTCPTCGAGLYVKFLEAGINPQISFPARAENWYKQAKIKIPLGAKASTENVDKLKIGMVAIFRFVGKKTGHVAHHVGFFKEFYPLYAVVREVNTSGTNTVRNYNNTQDGEFDKIRSYSFVWYATDWIPQSKPYSDTLKLKSIYKSLVK